MSNEELGKLRDEIARLQRTVDELESRARPGEQPTDPRADGRPSRRALLGGAVAAGGAAMLGSQRVAAGTANGQSVDLGEVNIASETTEIRYDFPIGGSPRSHVFAAQDGVWGAQVPGASATPETGTRAAIAGYSGNDALHGMYGQSNTGVPGAAGGRFHGESAYAYGVAAGGRRASMRLYRADSWGAQPPPPSRLDFHNEGEITIDSNDDLWVCVASGNPGTWRKLAGPTTSGAFHGIDPIRTFDSRLGAIPNSGKFAANTSRVISVKDARDVTTGAVTVVDAVPSGATAVTYNLTITQTVGAGHVFLAPGDATAVTSSSINWSSTGTTIANAGTVKLDGNRQVRVFSEVNATHVILDITGYYR